MNVSLSFDLVRVCYLCAFLLVFSFSCLLFDRDKHRPSDHADLV